MVKEIYVYISFQFWHMSGDDDRVSLREPLRELCYTCDEGKKISFYYVTVARERFDVRV